MIIPFQETTMWRIFKCGVCNNYFAQIYGGQYRCAVNHRPGTCCHHSEKQITVENMDKIQAILKETLK